MTIQLKAIGQYFHVVLFISLLYCTRWFKLLSLWMKPSVTIQIKAVEICFHVVLFNMMYKVVLTFKSLIETLVITIFV